MGKNICNNISTNLSGKYYQKRLDHAKNLPQMHLKPLQKESLKTAQATGNLIGKKLLIALQCLKKFVAE